MKVLMFGWEFPPYISGGLGTACYGITKGLSAHDVRVDFVLPKVALESQSVSPVHVIDASQVMVTEKHLEKKELSELVKFVELDTVLRPYMTEESYKEELDHLQETQLSTIEKGGRLFNFEGGYGKNLIAEVYRLCIVAAQLGEDTDAQVIHAHDWMTFPAAIAAKRASNLPLVVHVHATEFDRTGHTVNSKVYEIEKEGMSEADVIIAVSQRTKDIVVNNYGIEENKVKVVYNAVERSNVALEEMPKKVFKEPVVLFLGRITSQKGPSYFLETARIILEKNRNVRFVMAGSGDILPKMVRLCAEMRLQDRFHFTGFLRGKELEHIFAMSDVLVMPSVSEPFGIVPIEAIQYNLPVIISKQSGVAEVLPHAIKVDFWDTELFAKSILEILEDKDKREKHIEGNKEDLEKLKWDLSALEIINIYNSMVK